MADAVPTYAGRRPPALDISPTGPLPPQTIPVSLDEDGRPVRFYADHAAIGSIAPAGEPPADAINLTMTQFLDCLANPGRRRWIAGTADGGSLVECEAPDLPSNPSSRMALGSALRDALKAKGFDTAWAEALAGLSQDTRDWWSSGYRNLIPEGAVKLVRIAAACAPPVDLKVLYDAALSPV